MDAVFYSIAFGGSEIAPVQLVRSVQSLRYFDRNTRVFVFLFGEAPDGFREALARLDAVVRPLGDYLTYISSKEPARAELVALDPKIHRWLVLEESELSACSRLLYIDSDTFFFAPATQIFERYRETDFYAREEPFCSRSSLGYDPAYIDEKALLELRLRDGLCVVPPFNTGVCLFTSGIATAITSALPQYFDYLFRFLSWFHHHPLPQKVMASTSIRAVYDPRFRADPARALPYPSSNRWIVDQVAMWLALGQYRNFSYADLKPSDVWQGAEYRQMLSGARRPLLCHSYGSNTAAFFNLLRS